MKSDAVVLYLNLREELDWQAGRLLGSGEPRATYGRTYDQAWFEEAATFRAWPTGHAEYTPQKRSLCQELDDLFGDFDDSTRVEAVALASLSAGALLVSRIREDRASVPRESTPKALYYASGSCTVSRPAV